ncbi:hypothetical protein Tco_1497157, partial [Tanacetum coccineum]
VAIKLDSDIPGEAYKGLGYSKQGPRYHSCPKSEMTKRPLPSVRLCHFILGRDAIHTNGFRKGRDWACDLDIP